MQLFVLDTVVRYVGRDRRGGSENVTPIGCIPKAAGQRAGSYLQRSPRDVSRFIGPRNAARGADHWAWSVTRERVTWLSTRNPRSTLLGLGACARAHIENDFETDRMPSETTRLAVDFFYLLQFKLMPEVPDVYTARRSNSTKHTQRARRGRSSIVRTRGAS